MSPKIGDYDQKLHLVFDGADWICETNAWMEGITYSGRLVSCYPRFAILEVEDPAKLEAEIRAYKGAGA